MLRLNRVSICHDIMLCYRRLSMNAMSVYFSISIENLFKNSLPIMISQTQWKWIYFVHIPFWLYTRLRGKKIWKEKQTNLFILYKFGNRLVCLYVFILIFSPMLFKHWLIDIGSARAHSHQCTNITHFFFHIGCFQSSSCFAKQ